MVLTACLALVFLIAGCTLSSDIQSISENIHIQSVNKVDFSVAGGEKLVINGVGFRLAKVSVFLDDQACTSLSVDSDTQLTCTLPTVSSLEPKQLSVRVGKILKTYPVKIRYNVVLGQTSTEARARPGLRAGFYSPTSVAIAGGKMLAVDQNNHRVLIWNSIPTTNLAPPDLVLGQADFISNLSNRARLFPDADTMSGPHSVATDGTRVVVVDTGNNRLLVWNSFPTSNGQAADLVLGQPDFLSRIANNGGRTGQTLSSPRDVLIHNQQIYAVDLSNHRVLIWSSWPTNHYEAATLSLGQSNLTNGTSNSGPNTAPCGGVAGRNACALSSPAGVFIEGTKLYVADSGNNRVLVWNTLPTTQQQPANLVLGQTSMTSGNANNGPNTVACGNVLGRNRCSLSAPQSIYSDGSSLFISDANNNRVLRFNPLPVVDGAAATAVLGQPDFISATVNNGGISGQTLSSPGKIVGDGTKLLVVDRNNNRILLWNTPPTSNQVAADVFIGQKYADFSNYRYSDLTGASSELSDPHGVLIKGGTVFVADRSHNRVLIWNSIPTTNDKAPDLVLGQPDMSSIKKNNGPANASCGPTSGLNRCSLNGVINIASDGTRLIIVDRDNNRILIWNTMPAVNQQPADLVLGQPDFTSSNANNGPATALCGGVAGTNACSLNSPLSAFTDGTRLIVADQGNHRVLIWNSFPTTDQQPADVVLGQPTMLTSTVNNGPNSPACDNVSRLNRCSLSNPYNAIYHSNKLIVADASNARVLIWNSLPTANQTPADVVLGQPDFISATVNNGGISASSIGTPMGIDVDNGNLLMLDRHNHRMLAWEGIPSTNNAAAKSVFGQEDFTAFVVNEAASANRFLDPTYMSSTEGYLAIAEQAGNRITIRKRQNYSGVSD